ncbi:MAG: DUF805 domain-containing protein [Microbacterium sp.]|uniref:DUF805 domain-containing protein n=1 Tax=Microbacterium sp. TaxID=51671 RepID=UPI0039E22EAA
MTTDGVDAGWYPDPSGTPGERWWDGVQWTASTRAASASPTYPPSAYATPPAYAVEPYSPAGTAQPYAPSQPYAQSAYALPVGAWRSPVDDRPFVRGMGDAIRVVFAKYAAFDGRASLAEYWWFTLFTVIVTAGAFVLTIVPFAGFLVFYALLAWMLALIVPSLALTVRRLRDAGLHWAWIFLSFVPLGSIALIVMACMPSKYP